MAAAAATTSDDHVRLAEELVARMFEKKPPNTRITAPVCVAVMQKKFEAKFAGCDWAAVTAAVERRIDELDRRAAGNAANESDESDESDDDEEEEEEEEEDEEEEEEDDFDSDDSDEDDAEGERAAAAAGDDNAPALVPSPEEAAEAARFTALQKRLAAEEAETVEAEAEAEEGGGDATDGDGARRKRVRKELGAPARVLQMAQCLRKVGVRYREPAPTEALDDYLRSYLVPHFTANGLDPERYGKEDVKRYKMQKEARDLARDLEEHGVSADLDRRSRRNNVARAGGDAAAPKAKPIFMDDE